MLVEAFLLPLIIGKLAGGKFKKLLDIYIDKWWLILLAGTLEFIASIIRAREIGSIWEIVEGNIIWVQIISYSLLIIVILINRNQQGFFIILLGVLLNFIVIIMNHGRMPVGISTHMSPESIEYLLSGKDLTHIAAIAANSSTKLFYLGDLIHLPPPYPFPKSISIGDILLTLGLCKFIYCKMIDKEEVRNEN